MTPEEKHQEHVEKITGQMGTLDQLNSQLGAAIDAGEWNEVVKLSRRISTQMLRLADIADRYLHQPGDRTSL